MTAQDYRSLDPGRLTSRPFPAVKQDLRIVIAEEAFDRIVSRGNADTTREVGGILVGQVLRDDSGPYVLVDTTIDALHAEERGAELTITHATWSHVHHEMDTVHKSKRIVGWYHTHPGFGIFLSDRDLFIHQSFFTDPFQLALVYDPKSREHGLFQWREGAAVRARRYFVGTSEHLWDGDRSRAPGEAPAPAAEVLRTPAPPQAAAQEEPFLSARLLPTALSGVAALAVGAIFGWYLGTRGIEDVLNQAERSIFLARAQGAQETVAGLNGQLLLLLRKALGEGEGGHWGKALEQLDAVSGTLRTPSPAAPALQQAAQTLDEARASLAQARAEREMVAETLRQLDRAAERSTTSPASLARELDSQRALLRTLYTEVAKEVGRNDKRRAQDLLQQTLSPELQPREPLRPLHDAATRLPAPKDPKGEAKK